MRVVKAPLSSSDDLSPDMKDAISDLAGGKDIRLVMGGDIPFEEWPEQAKKAFKQYESRYFNSINFGQCLFCPKSIEDFPGADGIDDDFRRRMQGSGWSYYTSDRSRTAQMQGFSCPECSRLFGGGDGSAMLWGVDSEGRLIAVSDRGSQLVE